jgi:uncharacterized protein YlzI (FlbEa/FlbD family)
MKSVDENEKKKKYMRTFAVIVFTDLKCKEVSMNEDAIEKLEEVIKYYEETEDYEVCAKLVEYQKKLKAKYGIQN